MADAQSRQSVRPGSLRRTAIAAAGFALVLVVLLNQQVRHPYSVPDWGDPLFSMWRMGWVQHALSDERAQVFDGNIFHPVPLALTLSDTIILPAVASAPLRWLGLHPVLTYNLVFFLAIWLSGLTTYLLVDRLTGSSSSAFVAGLIYATYSYRFDHYSHLELQMTMWMPLGLMALHQFIATARWRHVVGLALCGVAQLYSGMYYAVFFLAYVVVVGTGLLVVHRPRVHALVLPTIGAALVAGALAVPIARAFAAAAPMKGERTVEETQYFSATPRDYLRANPLSAIWRPILGTSVPERSLFPGAMPIALATLALLPPLGATRVIYGVALVASVDLSLGLNGTLYPLLHEWIPPVRSLRSPARFGALVGLTLAILAGLGLCTAFTRVASLRARQLLLAALTAAVVVDAWPALTLVPVWRTPPAVYDALRGRSDVVLAELPVRPEAAFNAAYMYLSLWHWLPMVNGYSGFIPGPYAEVAPALQDFPLGTSVDVAQRLGVTHVTVNCGLRFVGEDDCQVIRARIRRDTRLHLRSATTWEGAPVDLYELAPRTEP